MKTAIRELSWAAILNGEIYCAPACGHGCTKMDYDEAIGDSSALALKLGGDWEPRVWENLGWHWEVVSVNGWCDLHESIDGSFTAMIRSEPGQSGGNHFASADTPQKAMAKAVGFAAAERAEAVARFDGANAVFQNMGK